MGIRVLSLATLMGMALVACEPLSSPTLDEVQPNYMIGGPFMVTVTGSGSFTWSHPDGREGWYTLSINARKDADGLVDGRFMVRNSGAPAWWRGVVTCFTTDAEQAWIEVLVEDASGGGTPSERAFWVEDLGEGEGAGPDRVALIRRPTAFYPDYQEPGDFCAAQPVIDPMYVREIEAGNIWVLYDPPRSVYK